MIKKSNKIYLFIIVFVVLFTSFVINHSFSRGRLQYEVDYEDVITFLDGLERYRLLVDEGQERLQFLYQYAVNPPHAPLHSLQAMLSFALLGIHDWAPYVSNGLLLFALLMALVYALRDFNQYAQAVGVFFLLCTPLAYHTIEEFRPDYPSAIATVWGILLYFQFLKTSNPWLAAWSGACYGLAMLAKPPVFPYVLAVGGGPFFWGLFVGSRLDGWRGVSQGILRAWPFFVGCAVVAGPHFVVAARKIIDYFVLNQLGADSHLWAFNEGWGQRIAYHIIGYGGWLGLGRHWMMALVLWGCAIIAGLKFARSDKSVRILLGLSGMTMWAYFFLVINPHMNPFFGITFQILLLFSSAAFLGWLVGQGKVLWRRLAVGGFVLAILGMAFLLAFRLPIRKIEFTFGSEQHREFLRTASADVMGVLDQYRDAAEGRYCLVSTYGAVSSHTLQWISDKTEKRFRFFGVNYEPIEEVRKMFDAQEGSTRVDFAVVSEPGILGVHEFLPNAKTSGPLLEYLTGHPEYREIGRVPDPNGKAYVIFLREPRPDSLRSNGTGNGATGL